MVVLVVVVMMMMRLMLMMLSTIMVRVRCDIPSHCLTLTVSATIAPAVNTHAACRAKIAATTAGIRIDDDDPVFALWRMDSGCDDRGQ